MLVLPMFPLGRVLFPTEILPLHIFEERYRTLVRDCLDGSGEFGVTLIERGSEVGGGDVRTDVGCVARMLDVREFEDGRFSVIAVGTRRVRVATWLPDAPYPRAEVEEWPEAQSGTDGQGLTAAITAAEARRSRVVALATELGDPVAPVELEFADDPPTRLLQLAATSPLGPLDAQRLLAAASHEDRAELLNSLLEEAETLLRARLSWGDD